MTKKLNFIIIIFFLSLVSYQIHAQELNLLSFKYLERNLSARINEQVDVNGKKCAVVIIASSFDDYEVEAKRGIEHGLEVTGEKMFWLSPDEYELIIRKKGYLPFSINLKDKLKSLETYKIVLSDDYGVIDISAPNAKIFIDDRLKGENQFTFREKTGKYLVKTAREKFYSQDTLVYLHPGDDKKLNFQLQPILGKLSINSVSNEFLGADIFINDKLSEFKTDATIPLIIGEHNVRIEKENYLPFTKNLIIEKNQVSNINLQMELEPEIKNANRIISLQKKKNNFIVKSILAGGSFVAGAWLAAETEGSNDGLFIVAAGMFWGGLIYGIISTGKAVTLNREIKHLENRVSLYPTFSKDGAGIGLALNF